MAQKSWKAYEKQVHRWFTQKYPEHEILLDQKWTGHYSKTARQVDVLVKAKITGTELIGVFDCKHFNKKVDVITIDMVQGFMIDVGASFGGVVSSRGFSDAARNRAENVTGMSVRVIPFVSAKTVVDNFVPSLDFSDLRNSMYIPIIV